MENLLNILKDQLSGEVLEKAAGFLGESSSNTESAISGLIPTIFNGLISKGSDTSGAAGLLNMINSGGHNGGIMDNIGSLFSKGDASNGLMNTGGGILNSLFGNKVGSIASMIASFSGMSKGSSSSLMSMVAPMVMGLIGKKVASGGLNAGGLMNLLQGQKGFAKDAMPSGMTSLFSKFGLDGLSNTLTGGAAAATGFAKSTANTAKSAAATTVETGKSGFGKLLPWLIGGILLLGALFAMRSCGGTGVDAIDNTVNAVTETAENAADATVDATKGAVDATKGAAEGAVDAVKGALSSITLPDGAKLDLPEGSLVDNFAKYLGSGSDDLTKVFTFDRLVFETGSSKLKGESQTQLNNLAAVMKAYKDVEVKMIGNTDNTGNAAGNKALSLKRAQSVKAALVGAGIAGGRIETAGVGADNPIATNDTDEGKQQNRRIDLQITKK